ncbi:hypothetical protein [Salinibacillus xinjiangensis]|uniref:Uncharacterized protein n=1 Tax=Salinibacillus xinjiangensis TaxID=1229268 RepID=A0A6G1X793_9BACI|nr:hypothetical protein [Salinibacillus xinjiangensis]MRG86776.1 hypothetical protein [Salinibacillus xinjiangensis]
MFYLGQKLFRNHIVQLCLIGISFALALIAQHLSSHSVQTSIMNFMTISFDYLFNTHNHIGFFKHIAFPAIFYVISSILLLWMGIFNLKTFLLEDNKADLILRMMLAILQIGLFGLFFVTGGMLFENFSLFGLMIFFICALIVSGFASDHK